MHTFILISIGFVVGLLVAGAIVLVVIMNLGDSDSEEYRRTKR